MRMVAVSVAHERTKWRDQEAAGPLWPRSCSQRTGCAVAQRLPPCTLQDIGPSYKCWQLAMTPLGRSLARPPPLPLRPPLLGAASLHPPALMLWTEQLRGW